MYRTVLIAGATAAAIAGGGAAALAATGPSSTDGTPSPSSSSSSSSSQHGSTNNGSSKQGSSKHSGKKGDKKGARRMLRHVDHADIVLHTKHGFVTREIIRGAVTSVSPSSVTVASADHTTRTFSVTKDTKVRTRSDGKPAASSISHVSKGDNVIVSGLATKSDGTAVARHVLDRGTK